MFMVRVFVHAVCVFVAAVSLSTAARSFILSLSTHSTSVSESLR